MGRNETMHHRHVGDDPQWVLYRQWERLAFTDPPVAVPPRPHHLGARRGVHAVIAAVAISAALRAGTTTATPTNLGAHGDIDVVPTRSAASGHRVDPTRSPARGVHRHSTLSHHTKEALP